MDKRRSLVGFKWNLKDKFYVFFLGSRDYVYVFYANFSGLFDIYSYSVCD
jgi:hypothetical protein